MLIKKKGPVKLYTDTHAHIYINEQNWSEVIIKWSNSKTLGVLLSNKNKVAQWFSRKSSLVWHIKLQQNTFEPWPNPFSAEFTEIS